MFCTDYLDYKVRCQIHVRLGLDCDVTGALFTHILPTIKKFYFELVLIEMGFTSMFVIQFVNFSLLILLINPNVSHSCVLYGSSQRKGFSPKTITLT